MKEGNGIPSTAISFCGLGPKIRVSYQCEGRSMILNMLQTPSFGDVIKNCKIPLSLESNCRRCVNSDIINLHRLIGAQDNLTLNTCRDAAFVALANTGDNLTALDMANCFFGVQGLSVLPANASEPPSLVCVPTTSPSLGSALAPSQHLVGVYKETSPHAPDRTDYEHWQLGYWCSYYTAPDVYTSHP